MRRVIATIVVTAAVAASCGTGGDSQDVAAEAPETQQAAPAPDTESDAPEPEGTESEEDSTIITFPDVRVHDVRTGDLVDLRSFAPSDRPIVLWFWAPH